MPADVVEQEADSKDRERPRPKRKQRLDGVDATLELIRSEANAYADGYAIPCRTEREREAENCAEHEWVSGEEKRRDQAGPAPDSPEDDNRTREAPQQIAAGG